MANEFDFEGASHETLGLSPTAPLHHCAIMKTIEQQFTIFHVRAGGAARLAQPANPGKSGSADWNRAQGRDLTKWTTRQNADVCATIGSKPCGTEFNFLDLTVLNLTGKLRQRGNGLGERLRRVVRVEVADCVGAMPGQFLRYGLRPARRFQNRNERVPQGVE